MALQDPRASGWFVVGGQQRDVGDFGGLDQDSWKMLQSLKDLRTEIGGAATDEDRLEQPTAAR